MDYSHTQRGPLHLIIFGVALLLAGFAWASGGESPAAIICLAVAALLVGFAFSFAWLSVRDEGQRLSVRFGPIPLFGTSIEYSDITRVETGRSTVLDGWGIHYIPGRGWTYNLWGFGCVIVYLEKTTVRIGSDDVENLIRFLHEKVQGAAA